MTPDFYCTLYIECVTVLYDSRRESDEEKEEGEHKSSKCISQCQCRACWTCKLDTGSVTLTHLHHRAMATGVVKEAAAKDILG